MKIAFVDLKKQYASIKAEIDEAIAAVIAQTAFVGGPFVKSFETAFAAFCGVRNCVGVGNGTDALYIALRALNVGPGDEVITAANSFIATSEAITMAGAKVVFADINPQTYTIDTGKLEGRISKKTKAIIPVHLFGQPADMDGVMAFAAQHDLKVVEDAAQAHGALHKGRPIGSIGHAACFSFYPGKNLGAYGDGGAIVTDDEELAERIRMIANHGRVDKYNHQVEGVNSRLDGLQAAILEVKLRHLPDWNERRRRNARLYNRHLQGTGVGAPIEIEGSSAVYHLCVIRVPDGKRDDLQAHLSSNGIATGIHYPIALPYLTAYRYLGYGEADFPEASRASRESLSLPMFPELEEAEISFVAERIKNFIAV